MCKISIIVVCLNPGDKLIETMESIRCQSFSDYEVVVKDGFSKDGSIEALQAWLQENGNAAMTGGDNTVTANDNTVSAGDSAVRTGHNGITMADKVHIHQLQDKSIYEAMNQACTLAKGEYFYFLNCGDHFYDGNALESMSAEMDKHSEGRLFYGNVYDALRESVVQSNPRIDAFACYRNVPCHQACIYHRSLFAERGYKPEYRVRADYEHFLWCFFEKKVQPVYVPVTLALYEGGGFSETEANRIRSGEEHTAIIGTYMSKGQIFKYKLILALTLQPVRTAMAESKVFGALYQAAKKIFYRLLKSGRQ